MTTLPKSKTTSLFLFFLPTTLLLILCFSNLVAQTGPNYAGTVVNEAGAGTLAWTNPANASGSADDDVRAETPSMASNEESQFLKATNFGFSIPVFDAIDGIEVKVEWHNNNVGNIRDIEVVLVLGDVIQTTENKASGANIPMGPPDGLTTYGGPADLWGLTLTKADIEDPGFGVALRVRRQGSSGGSPPHQALVDRISIIIHHSFNNSDSDPTNELNTSLGLTGTTLELTDAGGVLFQDLSSLNDVLQAEVDQNKIDIATNAADILALQTDVSANTAGITTNVTDIATNTADISTLQTDVSAISTTIANNASAIASNDADIATLQTDVTTNTSNIATNATAIAANNTDIAANAAAIAADTDGDPGNELNTSLTLNGTDLELTDDGGTLTADLSTLAGSDNDWTVAGNDMYAAVPGNVGIGTTSPSHLLQVNGTMAIGNGTSFSGDLFMASSSGSAFIYFEGGPTSAGAIAAQRYFVGQDGSGFMRLSQHPFHYGIQFGRTDDQTFVPVMTVNTHVGTESVGIGTTTPAAKLHVAGIAGVDGIMFPDGTLQTTAATGGSAISGNDLYLAKGMQEQQAQILEQVKKIGQLETQLDDLENIMKEQSIQLKERDRQINELKKENEEIRSRIELIERSLISLGNCCEGSSTIYQQGSSDNEKGMQLFQNVPNPFDGTTAITYRLNKPGNVSLRIYNEMEIQLETLVEAYQEAGEYTESWGAAVYPPGVYIYVLTQDGVELARKMILIK